jgi:hypothetical protein
LVFSIFVGHLELLDPDQDPKSCPKWSSLLIVVRY